MITVINHFHQILSLLGIDLLRAPVIEGQQIGFNCCTVKWA
tara:strand:- start:6407 stop:6529 length:123 start_codon:yes stop_codon:yes gene_type:complete